jgi:pyruvate dehydrogenase E1 component alpha subunit
VDESVGFKGAAPILASTLSIATGVALAVSHSSSRAVVVAYFGDAAVEEGVFHESLSFAALHRLPIVYVCENNLYSVHTPLRDRQPARNIADMARAHELPGVLVDGNDVRSVSVVAGHAMARARDGAGPTLIECTTYRHVGHVGPGSEVGVGPRSQEELTSWLRRDPLLVEAARLEFELPGWSALETSFEDLIRAEISDAYDFALSSPFPTEIETLADVYPGMSS